METRLPMEIWQEILHFSNFREAIVLKSINRVFNKLEIWNLIEVSDQLTEKLTKPILYNFVSLRKLWIFNANVADFNYLTNLTSLIIFGMKVTDESIKDLNLVELDIDHILNIKNISHMNKLRKLSVEHKSDISDSSLRNLDLVELSCGYNTKITDLNHLTNLTKLSINGSSGVSQSGILNLKLLELSIHRNDKITDLSFMTSLVSLNAAGDDMGLSNSSLENLNLTKLSISCNTRITDLNSLSKLKNLNISGSCTIITELGIMSLNLTELDIAYNTRITDLNMLTNLTKLTADYSGITDMGIQRLNLVELYASGMQLKSIGHMTNLKILHMKNNTVLTDKDLKNLYLIDLLVSGCIGITDLNHMTNLESLNISSSSITDDSLKKLNLIYLGISNSSITDLNHMNRLTTLSTYKCPNITKKSIELLEVKWNDW